MTVRGIVGGAVINGAVEQRTMSQRARSMSNLVRAYRAKVRTMRDALPGAQWTWDESPPWGFGSL
jgi:hypothetical protein